MTTTVSPTVERMIPSGLNVDRHIYISLSIYIYIDRERER